MADIERPYFEEGQILGAQDLNATVDHAAAQNGRHNRLLHTWGIAEGFAIHKTQRSDYVEFSIDPGVAIDGWGYELISTTTLYPSTVDFVRANVQVEDEDVWYPIYIQGRDLVLRSNSGRFASRCASASRLSVYERVELTFGSPGSQLGLANQTPAGVSEGPGTGAARGAWRILVGYVQWNGTNFADAIGSPSETDSFEPSEAVEPRWVGARAEQIEAPAGRLYLRTGPAHEAQVTVLALDHDDDALVLGKQDGVGGIAALMRVSPSGVVTAKSFESLEHSGAVLQSGMARDGMVLPLPAGIDAADLDDGAELHVQLTPRYGLYGYAGPPLDAYSISTIWAPELTVPFVLECRLDEDRRVHCRIRWVELGNHNTRNIVLPGVVDYTLVVTRQGEE